MLIFVRMVIFLIACGWVPTRQEEDEEDEGEKGEEGRRRRDDGS